MATRKRTAMATGRPWRLPGGWGIIADREVAAGDAVRVIAASGSAWDTTVTAVIGPDPVVRGVLAYVARRPRQA